MTTNISESLNYVFKDARGLPICALAEFYRDKLQAWFCERHAAAQSTFTHLTRWAERILKERLELARPLQVIYNFFSFFFSTKYSKFLILYYIYNIIFQLVLKVNALDFQTFGVIEEGKQYVVNIESMNCSCSVWDQD